ncbi:MAG: hybrid sensor histidine kinase/response regulator [Herminiimonas sp.]|nr:hybrid sensor histidine kinase/response regulator [Herminiimonas sp.]MDB5855749.1 hybrid sensor histidine kinase/response regulator [Herminiimonas sp.]
MIRSIRRSISRKLMLMVLATTFMALLVSGLAMLAYDIRNFRTQWIDDLSTQADILARTSAPAIQFDDAKAANETLALLKTRPAILAAAIYLQNGKLHAQYVAPDAEAAVVPPVPQQPGYHVGTDRITMFHAIRENGDLLGTVYLQASYPLMDRLKSYLMILGAVMLASLGVAALTSLWLQASFTRPILAITNVARDVIEHRDFSLRATRDTEDEIGVLVEAFNAMLSEVGRRARALEESNRILEHEMKERSAAEQALIVADRRKDEFLATLAHELRNPLAPMMNSLTLMRYAGPTGDAATQTAREIIERQLRQMVRLVDDLLDVSRITTGKLVVRKEKVLLQEVVNNAIETVMPLIESRGHHLTLDLPEEAMSLEADPARIAQVFSNLLNNAAKYTEPGGEIHFSVRREGLEMVAVISDNGIGIAADMLPQIFTMFVQADYSLERSTAGLGVGLTLARRLVELHGGSLVATSEGKNRGSTFTMRLPVLEPSTAVLVEPAVEEASARSQFCILLADDNVDFVSSMAILLGALGHEVHVAHNGADALELAISKSPAFCFLDIGLPHLNGYELARRLRGHPGTQQAVLIAITGWGQEKDKQLAHEAGFDRHFVKPVDTHALINLLAEDWRQRQRNGVTP